MRQAFYPYSNMMNGNGIKAESVKKVFARLPTPDSGTSAINGNKGRLLIDV